MIVFFWYWATKHSTHWATTHFTHWATTRVRPYGVILLFIFFQNATAQTLIWTNNTQNQNFFDENNWQDSNTNQPPANGTIDPNQPINLNLELACEVIANEIIDLGTGHLFIKNATLSATNISNGTIEISENGYLNLDNFNPIFNNSNINFISAIGWLKTTQITPSEFQNEFLNQISINENLAEYPVNIRLDNYYSFGTVVRMNDQNTTPLTIFDGSELTGIAAEIPINEIQVGATIPNGMNNQTNSFLLKKGFMATLAVNENGTGNSQVFIASEEDLVVNELPASLKNKISFIRVLPWNWVEKRGTGGDILEMDNTWFYRWNNQGAADIDREYVPMSWGKGGADENSDIEIYQSKYKVTHILGFNEPDDCNGQSGQFGNLCIPDTAVFYYKNLMKTGLRMVSPACREQAWNDWLLDFYNLAVAQDVRIDVIAVHWYDWASNPINSPTANPQNIFNRFKNYLTNVHNLYGLPIWVTEFNGNKHRTTAVNQAFMELALPYLDGLEYVERYAWFQPNSGVADYFDYDGNLTEIGGIYKNQSQVPSISAPILGSSNNLDIVSFEEVFEENCSINPTNFEEIDFNKNEVISIFPNPVSQQIFIETEREIEEVEIFDINRKLVKKVDYQYVMDISELEKGVYFIKINDVILSFIKF